MADWVLETRNLTKEFKRFLAVNDVNLRVRTGHIHALIGPNGAAPAGNPERSQCIFPRR